MVTKYFIPLFLACFIGGQFADACKNPKVEASSFATSDATIMNEIGYIAEFTLNCDEPLPKNYALYAEVEGKPLTAGKVGENRYQVSWTEVIAKARAGTFEVRVYDEEGWASLRRARRDDPNATVMPLLGIQLQHPGIYSGPWVNSEVLATLVSILVAYIAIRSKSKILA